MHERRAMTGKVKVLHRLSSGWYVMTVGKELLNAEPGRIQFTDGTHLEVSSLRSVRGKYAGEGRLVAVRDPAVDPFLDPEGTHRFGNILLVWRDMTPSRRWPRELTFVGHSSFKPLYPGGTSMLICRSGAFGIEKAVDK
jgi:hypothetical protein